MKRALLAALVLGGCASHPPEPITISAAIAGVQSDLSRQGVVSVSHSSSWTQEQRGAFYANVWSLQCQQKTPDPIVPMISGPVTMNLSGSFTQSGSFSVSASAGWPVFGLQSDAQRSHAQSLTLPVQFVPLSALADAEAQRQVEYAGNMLAQNDELRQSEGARIQKDRAELEHETAFLIRGYTGGICSPARPFVGAHHGP